MARQALLIANPASRKAPPLDRLRAAADGVAGWQIAIAPTQAAGHATEVARQAASDGLDAVVACGGDGTVNEVANGLAGSATALAVVRGGTANVWAKEVRIPKDPARALRLLAEGDTRVIDLGCAGGRYFVFIASLGFDAAVVRDLSPRFKQRFGAAAYILHALREMLRYRTVDAEIAADGAALSGPLYWGVLGNTRSYGGVVNVTDAARVDDGKLDLFLARRGGMLHAAGLLIAVLLRRHHGLPHVVYRTIESLDVATPGLPVQVDGEYLAETPLRFSIAPATLRVIVPRGLRSPLFSSATAQQ